MFLYVIFLKCCLVFSNPVIEKEVSDVKYMKNYCEHLICSTDFEQVNGNDKNQIMKSESTKSLWVSCIRSWVAGRSDINILKSIYYACFHSIIKYGIIWLGVTFCSRNIFTLSLILRRSRTGTVWFYISTSNKRAARPKLYTKSLTRDLKLMYSLLTLVRISINL